MKLRFAFGRLDGNFHDWRPKPGLTCEWPRYESRRGHVKRSCASVVPLGRDLYYTREGRKVIGRRLWIYRPSGACVNFDVSLVFDRCPYPLSHKFGPKYGADAACISI